jgi:hypothetical protein
MDWKAPTMVHEVKSFLGLAGYYHHFIPDLLKIAKPMTNLLQKDKKFIWTEECESFLHLAEIGNHCSCSGATRHREVV